VIHALNTEMDQTEFNIRGCGLVVLVFSRPY